MLRRVEYITVVDEDSRGRLIETGVDPSRVMVLPNAVDLRPYTTPIHAEKEFDAIYTGRLLDMKEPENLIQTWRACRGRASRQQISLGGAMAPNAPNSKL